MEERVRTSAQPTAATAGLTEPNAPSVFAAITEEAGARLDLFRRIRSIEMDALLTDGRPPPIASLIARVRDKQKVQPTFSAQTRPHFCMLDPMGQTLQSLAFHAPELCQDIVSAFGENPERALATLQNLRGSIPVYLLFSDQSHPGGKAERFFYDTCHTLSEFGFRCIWVSFSESEAEHRRDRTAIASFFEEVKLPGRATSEAIEEMIAQFKPDLIHAHGPLNKLIGPSALRNRVPTMLGYHSSEGLIRPDSESRGIGTIGGDPTALSPEDSVLDDTPSWITSYVTSASLREAYLACGGRTNLKAYDPPLADEPGRPLPLNWIKDALALTKRSPKRNIGVFAPWSEQGLGELARIYARVLRRSGFAVHILSFQAYEAKDRGVAIQHHADDWVCGKDTDTVHYSLNDREHVTLHEFSQFISTRNIGRFVYLELRLLTNWQKIVNLKMRNLEIIAVPMIESVGRSEVANHNRLEMTWCATRQCEDILRDLGVKNTFYVGHGLGSRLTRAAIDQKKAIALSRKTITFCHFGGHDPHLRKRTEKIVEAFNLAAESRDDISLKVYVMRNFAGVSRKNHPRITYHLGSLPHSAVLEVYHSCDVSIQVSSHEGLGLGFYESLATGTPVLSLDLAPHNEVIRPGTSGWLLPVQSAPRAHPDGIVPGGEFKVRDLADTILRIRREEVADMIETTAQLHMSMFDEHTLAQRLGAALWWNKGPAA